MRDFRQKIILRYRNQTLALALASAISGCASLNTPNQYNNEQLKLSQYATLTSAGAVKTLEHDYLTKSTGDVPKLAPEHFTTAGQALNDAKNLLKKNGSRDAIVRKVAVGQIVLRDATQVANTVKHMLSDELTLKNKLDSLETNEIYRTEYGALQERLNQLIRNVESGKVAQANNREKLLKDMRQVKNRPGLPIQIVAKIFLCLAVGGAYSGRTPGIGSPCSC